MRVCGVISTQEAAELASLETSRLEADLEQVTRVIEQTRASLYKDRT